MTKSTDPSHGIRRDGCDGGGTSWGLTRLTWLTRLAPKPLKRFAAEVLEAILSPKIRTKELTTKIKLAPLPIQIRLNPYR